MRMCLTIAFTLSCAVAASSASAQDAAAIKRGQGVYTAQKCQTCHSVAGKGAKANPLDGAGAKLSADDIRNWITNPTEMTAKTKSTKKPPMPKKYGKLPAADLDALVAYLQTLKQSIAHAEPRAVRPTSVVRRRRAADHGQRCHFRRAAHRAALRPVQQPLRRPGR